MRSVLLAVAFLLAFGSPAHWLLATDYFVIDNDGPTGGDGSQGSPWGTITEALNSGTTFNGGDVLNVAAGTYSNTDETFPLTIPSGVEIQGAGVGQTILDASPTGFNVFLLGGQTGPTALLDLEMRAGVTATVVRVTDTIGNLRVEDCLLSGGNDGFAFSANATGPVDIDFRNNSVINFQSIGFDFDNFAAFGLFSLSIVSNTMQPAGTGDVLVDLQITADRSQIATFNATVSGNDLMGPVSFDAVDIDVNAYWFSASMDATIKVIGNDISMAQTGVDIDIEGTRQANAAMNLILRDNEIMNIDFDGVELGAFATRNADVVLSGVILGNAVIGAGRHGFEETASVFTGGGTALVSCDVYYNCAISNGGNGWNLWARDLGSGQARFRNRYLGNVITNNGESGVFVGNIVSSGTAIAGPDWGGSAFARGLNTIQDNQVSAIGLYEFNLSATGTATVMAQGNWWGTESTVAISSLVQDVNDDTSFLPLDFTLPLPNALEFSATPKAAAAGQTVTLTITNDAAFVPYAGNHLISVEVGNQTGNDVSVSPDGRTLTFRMPAALGSARVTVTNPGGQIGSVLLSVTGAAAGGGDGGGGCFIATAAHGDDAAPEVLVLRRWRDECLAGNAVGRQLVDTYYTVAPGFADAIADRPLARAVTRAAIAPVVGAARLWMDARGVFLALVIAGAWLSMRRKRA